MLHTVRTAAGRVAYDRPRGGRKIPHVWTAVQSSPWVTRLIETGDLEIQPQPAAPVVVMPVLMPVTAREDEPGERMVDVPASIEPDVSPESALTQAPAEPRPAARNKSKRSPLNGA